ncbi:hypothetical protein ACQKMY_22420 [Peribacillus frigoritolerans]|uniref:hypothetical protein n=1 Tax=Peribacillus frigoritolerans TaxID=450367 RepID=UPI003D06088B
MPRGRTESLDDVFFVKAGMRGRTIFTCSKKGMKKLPDTSLFGIICYHTLMKHSRLKQRLAAEFPDDIKGYVNGKNDFIKKVDEKAKHWAKRGGHHVNEVDQMPSE